MLTLKKRFFENNEVEEIILAYFGAYQKTGRSKNNKVAKLQ